MHAYRFHVTVENVDDFSFEIDVLPQQRFSDFHKAIQTIMQFEGQELASFYVSNNSWKKKMEITLIDMNIDEDVALYEDDENNKFRKKKVLLMDKTKLSDIIEDPHQRFIYLYDFLNPWVLYIEMIKIVDVDKTATYPLADKIKGHIPTKKTTSPPVPEQEKTEEPLTNSSLDDYQENEDGFDDEDIQEDGYDNIQL